MISGWLEASQRACRVPEKSERLEISSRSSESIRNNGVAEKRLITGRQRNRSLECALKDMKQLRRTVRHRMARHASGMSFSPRFPEEHGE